MLNSHSRYLLAIINICLLATINIYVCNRLLKLGLEIFAILKKIIKLLLLAGTQKRSLRNFAKKLLITIAELANISKKSMHLLTQDLLAQN